MKIDTYTKIILTLIAVALWGILLSTLFQVKNVDASTDVIDVNLRQIDGRSINKVLDVNIQELNGISLYRSLPVEFMK